jgi:hypothetical protein
LSTRSAFKVIIRFGRLRPQSTTSTFEARWQPFRFDAVQSLVEPRIGQRSPSRQNQQRLQDVVMPVQRVVELKPHRVDDLARPVGAEQTMTQEEIGGAIGGLAAFDIAAGAMVFDQSPQRRQALVE